MSGLGLFWCIVVTVALLSYFGLACVITIGGFFDLKKMFSRLNKAHASEELCEQDSGGTPSEAKDHGIL